MAAFLAILPGLLGIILAGLQAYIAAAPQRKINDIEADDEKLREECLNLDADAIGMRIDRILHPPSGDIAGQSDDSTKKGATSAQ